MQVLPISKLTYGVHRCSQYISGTTVATVIAFHLCIHRDTVSNPNYMISLTHNGFPINYWFCILVTRAVARCGPETKQVRKVRLVN